ncbi:hypothetical protein ACQKDS_05220 [Serratia sp. NPDC078593]|uniref:hypothetical protein n=1 Tax=unclassified Serratia (in: enterobacteria) TaxID=2647522 RepID=UPI0037D6D257
MTCVFFTRQLEITPELQVSDLQRHANHFLRYNNINDMAHSGPNAIEWFLNRANVLFAQNCADEPVSGKLRVYYFSLFCKAAGEPDEQALPVYDFLKVEVLPGGQQCYGVMFSSQMREYYRDRLEKGLDTSKIPVDQAFFKSIFRKDSPETGILDSYPVIMIPRSQDESRPSLTHIYLSSLGLDSQTIRPASSDYPFRFYFKDPLDGADPIGMAAIAACGQAMFEIIRPNLYPLAQCDKPQFDMAHLIDIKWEQHKTARKWVADHQSMVNELMTLHGISAMQ